MIRKLLMLVAFFPLSSFSKEKKNIILEYKYITNSKITYVDLSFEADSMRRIEYAYNDRSGVSKSTKSVEYEIFDSTIYSLPILVCINDALVDSLDYTLVDDEFGSYTFLNCKSGFLFYNKKEIIYSIRANGKRSVGLMFSTELSSIDKDFDVSDYVNFIRFCESVRIGKVEFKRDLSKD